MTRRGGEEEEDSDRGEEEGIGMTVMTTRTTTT